VAYDTAAWSAGGEDAGSVKAATRAGEGRKQPSQALSGKTLTLDPQEAEIKLLQPVSPLNRAKSGKIGHFQTFEV